MAIGATLGLSAGPGETVTATLSDGTATVSAPLVFGDLRIESPVRLAIPSARLARAPDGSITLDTRLLPKGLTATLALKSGQRMDVGASAGEIDLSLHGTNPIAGQLQLRGGSLLLPGQDVLAERIEATIPFPLRSGGEPARLSATVSTPSGRLAPLVVDGRVTVENDAFLLNGSIGSPDHGVQIPLQARYLGTEPRGSLTLGPATLEFRPDALQPKALGSALAIVTRAEGALDLSGVLAFAAKAPLDGKASVAFRDLTVETDEGVIEKLSGAIRLDGLFPPRTAGEQTLSARRVVAGVPLEEPSLRFRLEPAAAGTILVVDHAEGKIAEGTVHVDGARFDPSAARNAIAIGIDGLSLDRLLRDYAMEGLSGTGTLSGVIPMAFSAAGVSIESGAMQAKGGGVLKVAWGSARDTLMRQGEQVALMVQALEDFHYSSLRITINRPSDGSLSLMVAMEGHNPAVKDGYPIRFNIALSGELEKILAAIREGGRLGTDLFRGSLGGAP
ncbi:MAG TPA: YdbH domain-containing protein [Phycisphaerae bacterium]|nr:YdbH domain-containing protein [Phycisphaerae bacterium]